MIELTSKNRNQQEGNNEPYYQEIIEVSAKSKSKSRSQGGKRSNSISELSIKQSASQIMSNDKNAVYIPPYILKLRKFLDLPTVQIVMTTLTIYILFADDIKNLATSKTADNAFSSICVALMSLFFIELIISAVAVEDYFLGFYFWLDFVSLVSMLLDVHWFYDWMVNTISNGGGGKQAKSIGAIAKAGKSAKIAARAIRILRILRIIRLVRVSKLYKAKEKIIKLDMKKKEIERKKKEEEERAKQAANHPNQEIPNQNNANPLTSNQQKEHDNRSHSVPINNEKEDEETDRQNKEDYESVKSEEESQSKNGTSSMSKSEEDAGKVPEESKVENLSDDAQKFLRMLDIINGDELWGSILLT